MADVNSIASYLKVLGLSTTKLPTVEKVRSAFRKQALERHPDKIGVGSTAAFQELNEACARVIDFLAQRPSFEESTSNQDDINLLNMFKSADDIKFNLASVTIIIDDEWGEEFISAVESAVGPRHDLPKDVAGGIVMKCDNLTVKHSTKNYGYGAVIVRTWLRPKSGIRKMVIEGKGYMAFVSQSLYFMLKRSVQGFLLSLIVSTKL